MQDVIDIHGRVCPRFDVPELQLSVDGIQECRSNSVSMDVYSVKMTNCRNIYPLTIVRPLHKFRIDYKPLLTKILKSLHDCQCIIKTFIGDNPKRAIIREALNHASKYACEYCMSKAVLYSEQNSKTVLEKKMNELKIKQLKKKINKLQNIPGTSMQNKEEEIAFINELIEDLKQKIKESPKKQSHCVWPESTSTGQLRTKQNILEIVDALEANEASQFTADDAKGFVGRSLLLDIDYFDFVGGVPVEYMHGVCLGVVKR